MRPRMRRLGSLDSIVVGELDGAEAVIVLLHGYAMDPQGFAPFCEALGLPAAWVLPQGPEAADPDGHAWWPIDASVLSSRTGGPARQLQDHSWPERPRARAQLRDLLAAIRAHSPHARIILGGFSQGGMLSMDLLLSEGADIDGLIVLSSSRIAIDEWTPELHRLRDLPVLLAHGTRDEELAYEAGLALREMFETAGARVTWITFDEGHLIPLVVWRNIRRFFTIVQNPAPPNAPDAT